MEKMKFFTVSLIMFFVVNAGAQASFRLDSIDADYGGHIEKTIYNYDSSNRLISMSVGKSTYEYEYDIYGNLKTEIYSYNDGMNPPYKTDYYYENNKCSYYIEYRYLSNDWKEIGKYEYEYYDNGYIKTEIISYNWSSGFEWYQKKEYVYSVDGLLTKRYSYNSGDWIETVPQYIEYEYDNNNIITEIVYGEYPCCMTAKNEYEYDENDNIITKKVYTDIGVDLICTDKFEYEYDENGNKIIEKSYRWNWSIEDFIYDYIKTYYYSNSSSTFIVEIDITSSIDRVTIEWQPCENAEGYKLIIYGDEAHTNTIYIFEFDASGELLRSASTNLSHTIENLQSGTDYFYTLEILGVSDVVLASQSGKFTTSETTSIDASLAKPAETAIVGYYSVLGEKLPQEPEKGLYIILYSNGKAEKIIKK